MFKKCVGCGKIWCNPRQKSCSSSRPEQCKTGCGWRFETEAQFRAGLIEFTVCGSCLHEAMSYFERQFYTQQFSVKELPPDFDPDKGGVT